MSAAVSDVVCDVVWDIVLGVLSDVLSGVLSDVASDVASGVVAGLSRNWFALMPVGIRTGKTIGAGPAKKRVSVLVRTP
jgi:hypothetical protein